MFFIFVTVWFTCTLTPVLIFSQLVEKFIVHFSCDRIVPGMQVQATAEVGARCNDVKDGLLLLTTQSPDYRHSCLLFVIFSPPFS